MKIALSQINVARGDPAANLERIAATAEDAAAMGADLLCLPEMVTTGFDWSRNRELLEAAAGRHERVSGIAASNKLAICGSFLERTESGMPANTLIYFDSNGDIRAKYRKIHLFSLFKEDQHVEPGQEIVVADIGHCVAGFAVCYDLRFPEIFSANTKGGAVIQIVPAAFPHPRMEHWRTLIQARAIENQCYIIAVNQVGVEGHGDTVGSTHYFGHSMIVDPWGEVLVEGGEEPQLLIAEIDLQLVENTRSKLTALKDRRPDLY